MTEMEETDYAVKHYYIGCSLAVAYPSLDLATQKSCPSEVTGSTTCSSEAVTATSQPSRSQSVPSSSRVQVDSAESKIHVLGVAYMYMKYDGHLDFLPAQANPDGDEKAMFEKIPVNNPGFNVQEIFKLKNVKYGKCLTGHIVGNYPMTVNGIEIQNDESLSYWKANKVQTPAHHTYNLELGVKNDYFFYVKDGQFKLQYGEPNGADDHYIFQFLSPGEQ